MTDTVGEYRNDLDAAHQRIAALESELAEAREAHAASVTERVRGREESHEVLCPREVSAAQREFEAHVKGTAVPTRLKLAQAAGVVGFLALHTLIALVTLIPHIDGWTVFFTVGPLLPLVLAMFAGRYVRALVDPAVGFFQHGNPDLGVEPSIAHYTRRHAGIGLAVLVALELGWCAWLLPTMQHAMGRDCPVCAHREPAR